VIVGVGRNVLAVTVVALVAAATGAGGCSSTAPPSGFTGPGEPNDASIGSGDGSDDGSSPVVIPLSPDGSFVVPPAATPPPCEGGTGWHCKVNSSCSTPTSLTGKVFDPAGKNPLYDVVVFVPNDVSMLPAITQGTKKCDTCADPIGDYVVATTTDYTGTFTLKGVPTSKGVPVTVQIGKWRRTIGVDITNDCGNNNVSMSPTASTVLRLPAKKSEGDMPEIALLTGGCDDMACFLMNMGVDASEFSGPGAGGRVAVYQGNSMPLGFGGAGPTLSTANGTAGVCTGTNCPLWSTVQGFEAYDIAMLSCECSEGTNVNENAAAYTNLRSWLNEGGKVFASHYHYTWFRDNPSADFQGVANWGNTGNNDIASAGATGANYDIDDTFPKSVTFGQWLGAVGALSSTGAPPQMNGTPVASINLKFVADSVKTVNAPTSRWIYDPATGTGEGGTADDVKYLSFDTPIGGIPNPPDAGPEMTGKQYCGKAVYTDLHTGGSLTAMAADVPGKCTKADLTAQQKALEFLFFDLAACVTDDTQPPPPPPPPMIVPQ